MAVYRPRPPGDPLTFLELSDGWLAREPMPDGRARMRWVPQSAALIAWTFGDLQGAYTLRFDTWSFHRPRRLEVRIDGRSIGQWLIGDLQHLDIPVALADGRHQIELRSLDPPQSPASVGAGDDPRPLAIAVSQLNLVPRGGAAR